MITPVAGNAAGALALGAAMNSNAVITSASIAVPPNGTPNGTATALNQFPTAGATFSILTNGDVKLADDPNLALDRTGADDGGPNVRGSTDFDVTVLKLNITVPPGANCLRFDFKFFSEEFPDGVDSQFNDAFIAEWNTSNWTTSGISTITAPNNFAFDQNGKLVSVNTSGHDHAGMTFAAALGTVYNGATPLLSAAKQVAPGTGSLYLSIFDQWAREVDSAVFLDNLTVSSVPDPANQCKTPQQLRTFELTLTPPSATNTVGTTHTVTATLSENEEASWHEPIRFTVTGANPRSGIGVTNTVGKTTFTYTGTNTGDDMIAACYDADENGVCGNAEEPIASVTKKWVTSTVDIVPPSCALTKTGTTGSGAKFIEVTLQDTGPGSGLRSIVVDKSTNATVVVPAFSPGTKNAVVVRAIKINQSLPSTVQLTATDVAGNKTTCDRVFALLQIRKAGKPVSQTYTGLPQAESKVRIANGSPGVKRVKLVVNGTRFKVWGLADGEVRFLDVSAAMRAGNANTITVTARGKRGGSVVVIISD